VQVPVLRLIPGLSIARDVVLVAEDSSVYSPSSGRNSEAGGSVATPIDVNVRAAEDLLRACTVGHDGTAQESSVAAGVAYKALFKELAPMLGESGVHALFARSLKLTSARFPCLRQLIVTAEPSQSTLHLETQLINCLSEQGPTVAVTIATALYATFLGILVGFIGDGLVRQILNQVFAVQNELPSKEVS
jgi:hypothetical protein